MLAACSFLQHSASTRSIFVAMFIFYMSPIICFIWGLILTVVKLREGLKKNVKLGFLPEPPLTPPPLQTWAQLLGNIVLLEN